MLLLAALVAGAAELALPTNRDLVGDSALDAACLKSKADPKLPPAIELPVGAAAERVALTLVTDGPPHGAGQALRVTLVYADGVERAVRLRWGEDLLPRPAVVRQAVPVTVGTSAAGAPVLGMRWVTPTGRDVPLARVVVDAPAPTHTFCVAAAAVDGPALAETFRTDTTGWYPFVHAWDQVAPVPQALPVQGPAGAKGFVRQDEAGHLVWEDGTRARFWGINLVAGTALPPKDEAETFARTLARLGFNLVRLHHFDLEAPHGVVNPRRGEPGQPELDPEMLDRFDFFVAKLREQGIYVFLEVATFRTFTAADGVPMPAAVPNGHKLTTMFEPAWADRYERWFVDFWGRANPYTGLRYPDDPAVVCVELSNEHSMLASWGFGIENLPRAHLAVLDARWNAWLEERYGDDAAIAAAWTGTANAGLVGGETLTAGTVAREPRFAAQFDKWPTARLVDLYTFYAELEETFYRRLERTARGLGFRVPILPTISYDLPHIQVIRDAWGWSDAHFQWDMPNDGVITRRSALATPDAWLGRLSSAGDGHVVTLSEIGHAAPNPFRAEAPFLWASIASLQDWDMVVWFSWADATGLTRDVYGLPPGGELRTAPGLVAQLPSASAAFRAGWIPRAPGELPLHFSEDVARLRTGEDALLRRPATFQTWGLLDAATALRQRVRTSFAPVAPPVVPGEPAAGVGWWAEPGLLLVDRPTLQVRVGPPEGEALRFGAGITSISGLEVALDGWAAVSLVSGDGQPLGEAREALLTVATTQEASDLVWGGRGTLLASAGRGPVLVEPARGTIRLRWPRKPAVTVLGDDGRGLTTLEARPVKGRKGWWELELRDVKSPWMAVR